MSLTLFSSSFTTLISPIHQVMWTQIEYYEIDHYILTTALDFLLWGITLILMLIFSIVAENNTVFIISLVLNLIALGMTIFHVVHSSSFREKTLTKVQDLQENQLNKNKKKERRKTPNYDISKYRGSLLHQKSEPNNSKIQLRRNESKQTREHNVYEGDEEEQLESINP